jgi:hypothetical protein
MKTRIAYTVALALLAYSLTACTTTITTLPDGTTIKTTGPDAASVNAAVVAAQIIAEK